MTKLNVGIIGAGRIGQLHATNILQSNLLNLKAISDVKIDHLKGTDIERQIPMVTTNPEKIITKTEIDAIFICTSTDTHAEYIKKAALTGKHIFCEKPISFNIDDTKEVLRVVNSTGIKLQVGFNRRFDKHFRKVYEMVKTGKIGTPHIIKICSRDPEVPPEEFIKYSGGMFMDMTIHDFDMVRYLTGDDVLEVSVKATNLVDPVFAKYNDIDTAVITLKMKSGAIAVIDNSRQAVYGYDQRVEVFGDKGAVSAANETETNIQIATRETVKIGHPKHFFLERYKEAYVDEVEDFARSIIENRPIKCTGEDGYKAELLALAAQKSWKENRSVLLEELTTIEA